MARLDAEFVPQLSNDDFQFGVLREVVPVEKQDSFDSPLGRGRTDVEDVSLERLR